MDQLKILEARLMNLHLLVLSIKHHAEYNQQKGQLVDSEYAMEATGVTRSQLQKYISKNQIPVYFFETDLKAFLESTKKEEVVNG